MARSKKDKIFDLFKKDFKITFFYKPSLELGDEFYYIVLDEIIRLKIKIVRGVVVIDDVIPITSGYIMPIYEKMVKSLMDQTNLTVLVSLLGNTSVIQKACVSCGAPIASDERYITVPKAYYDKVKANASDESSYGFYILSVAEDTEDVQEIGKPTIMMRVSEILKAGWKPAKIEQANDTTARFELTSSDTITVEILNREIYIKNFMSDESTTKLNFIQMVNLIELFASLVSITPNVYLISITNADVFRFCKAKGYQLIEEKQVIPDNKLFKPIFHGFGSFKFTINN